MAAVMSLGRGEPAAGPWRAESPAGLIRLLRERAPDVSPLVVAIDGRSASGKTTLAAALHAAVPASVVVHTDDVAWNHSFFGWTDLLIGGVLEPVRRGRPVSYRPPAWEASSRAGSIEVPAGLDIVVIEGVGAARRELMHLLDRVIWVQSDAVAAERRGIARDGGDDAAASFWHEWQQEEEPFLADQRPWERADVIVAGTPTGVQAPAGQLVIAER
jgi:hypothetical protein